MWSHIFLFCSLPRRRPPEFTAILMFEFWREATATSVPGLLCQSGRRRPENVSILSSLMKNEGTGSSNIVRAIPQLWIVDSYMRRAFLLLWVFFNIEEDGKDRELMLRTLIELHSDCFPAVDFPVLVSVFLWIFVVKTVVFLYFLQKKGQVDCSLNVCVGSHLEKRERTQCMLVLLLSLGSLWSLKSGFHMTATIATIAEIELRSISAIVVAAIAEEWFPYDRCDRWTFFQRRDRSDHMETRLYVFEMNR